MLLKFSEVPETLELEERYYPAVLDEMEYKGEISEGKHRFVAKWRLQEELHLNRVVEDVFVIEEGKVTYGMVKLKRLAVAAGVDEKRWNKMETPADICKVFQGVFVKIRIGRRYRVQNGKGKWKGVSAEEYEKHNGKKFLQIVVTDYAELQVEEMF